MKFNIKLIKDFEKYLQNHQNELKELYQKMILESYDSGLYSGLNSYFTLKKPIRIERESLIPLVEQYFSVSVIEYINNIYGFKVNLTKNFENDYNEHVREEVEEMYKDKAIFVEKCFNDFWQKNPHFESNFKLISEFEPLEKLTFEKDIAFGRFVSRRYTNINVKNWIDYIKKIFKFCLSDFDIDSKSDKNVFRVFRKINNEIYIGIEFPLNITKSYFKKGDMTVDYISVVVFNDEFLRKSKGYNGVNISDENIFTLFNLELSSRISTLPSLAGCFNLNFEYEVVEEGDECTLQAKHFNEDYVKRFCFMYFVTMLKTQEPIINFFIDKFLEFNTKKQ